ncbi:MULTISPECIES: restriction endonuclease subunit S [unclassified Moraxella]|uniref:restriction endonuclease subunit S n=1 Tax=unclassified Moraxella TaxID=2685852 RepID=UPI00359D484F
MKTVRLGDIGNIVTGKTPSSKEPQSYGNEYLFITPSDNFDEKYIKKTIRYLSEYGKNSLSGKLLKENSILVTCIGSAMGKVAINKFPAITNQQINSIEVKLDFDTDYIYYCLKNNYALLRNASSGSTALPILNKTDFENLSLKIHKDLKTQQSIAKILSQLDQKIALNNQINAQLEQMAKTIYDYWFVQFDFPDENGKPYKSSGGEMVYNEVLKREIPVGWSENNLWSIATYFNGLALQNYRPINSNDYLPVIKIKEMNNGISNSTEKADINIPKDAIIDDGDILFSWSATLDVKIWSQGKGALNQHIFKVTSKEYPKIFIYFELLRYLKHFKMMAELRKTTMGHITQDHLKQAYICIPTTDLLEKIENLIKPIVNKQLLAQKQNQQLTQLRDFLLPMLMNGQVGIADD